MRLLTFRMSGFLLGGGWNGRSGLNGSFPGGLAELVGGSLFCVFLTGPQERVLFQPP